MKKALIILLLLYVTVSSAQSIQKLQFNKGYDSIRIDTAGLTLPLNFEKGSHYQVLVLQQGIDVMLTLFDNTGKKLLEKDSPNGKKGFEIFEYVPVITKAHTLTIRKFEEEGNTNEGFVSIYIKKYTPKEVALLQKTQQELAVENNRNVLSLDIDHFWEAFDNLKDCHTKWDSILSFQDLYLDRATNGLIDFIKARNFAAEEFVATVAKYPRYYNSVRPYTFEAKKAEPLIQEVFDKLKSAYSNFKPFKVCFAIGVHNTGGTVSDRFVLLGTEMITTGRHVDFSELGDNWKPKDTLKEPNIPLAIKGIVTHECVHTQQRDIDSNAITCMQLYNCLREGAANFIGELLSGTTNYSATNQYGDKNENALWKEFKSTLCASNANNWLYNGNTVKDRPADLGYYIGYKISQAYYNRATDKQQAIREIIDMNDPLAFLQRSGYDGKKKQ